MSMPRAALCLGVLVIAACDGTAPATPPKQEPLPESSLHAPLDQARALEDQLLEAQRAQDAKLEEQGG